MRAATLRVMIGCALVAAGIVAMPVTSGAQPPAPFPTGPPPIINMDNVPAADLAGVQAFETNAVHEVLTTHGLPSGDAGAVLGWGRNDVRAQEWLDLASIINESPSVRAASAQDSAVYDWFQRAYAHQQLAAAQDAISEYQFWSGEPISSTGPPVGFGAPATTSVRGGSQSVPTGYCDFAPPGGDSGPFANTYTGNQDPTCYPPYQCPGGLPVCSVSYPTLQDFQNWGSFDATSTQVSTPDFASVSLGTSAAIGVGASLAVASIVTPLSATLGGAGVASTVSQVLFPFAARVFFQFAAGAVDAASAGADAAAASAALTAGAIAFVVGIAIFFIVSTALAIVQIVQDQAIPGQLESALSDAQQASAPDLSSVISGSDGYAALYATFLAAAQPDVDYDCTAASPDPCADAPAVPAQDLSTDPQFLVTTTSGGVATTVASPTIYTEDSLTDTYVSTRLSGNGWFVGTKYAESPSTLHGPAGSLGATFESLQLPYTDWSGNHWMLERIVDASTGAPEFVRTPLDDDIATGCVSSIATTSTGATACVTNKIDVTEPDGTEAVVQVVPADAVAPTIAAAVPANATTSTPTALQATGSDPSNLALSYSWLIECPGTYVSVIDGHSGYAGFPCDLTGGGPSDATLATTVTGADASFSFQQPGLYPVTVTATDTNGYSATEHFDAEITGATTTTVTQAWPTQPNEPTYGEPVAYTATVSAVSCACASGLGGELYPGGSVQFSLDGSPYGSPVQLSQLSGSSSATATETIADLPVTPGSAPGHVVTAQYLPGLEYLAGSPPVPILSAAQGFLGSSGAAASALSVGEGSTSTQLSTTWSTSPSPLAFGQPLDVSATVTPTGASSLVPTGEVQFLLNGKPDGAPVQVDANGTASTVLTDLPVTPACNPFLICLGNELDATYVGDAGYQTSTATTTGLFVTRAATTTLAGPDSSATPVSGQATKLDALITVDSPGQATPTGTVSFANGAATLGTVPFSYSFSIGGFLGIPLQTYYVAALTTAALRAGSHSITATYSGDADTAASSTSFPLTIARAAATASVSTSPTAVAGAPVHLLARVTAVAPGSGTPTGSVAFYDGTAAVAGCTSVPVTASSTATCVTAAPPQAGSQTLSARYSGDTDFTAATSPSTTLTTVYGFGHFWRPLLEHNVLREGAAIPVSFQLENADGSFISRARDAALASAGNVSVVFSGPGIAPITTACSWVDVVPRHFSCDFTPPSGLPASRWYAVTAYERISGKLIRIPTIDSSSFNPVVVRF